jgi:hypothetical protein
MAKELYNILVRLEVASLGLCKEIACLLTKKATMDNMNKVNKYLRSKGKKGSVARKAPTVDRYLMVGSHLSGGRVQDPCSCFLVI